LHARVIFPKKSRKLKSSKSNVKFPLSTVNFLGVRALTSSYIVHDHIISRHADL